MSHDLFARIRAQWAHLTEDDVQLGLTRRESLLERLRDRHHLGMDEAEAQLHEFEKKNPALTFEKS